MPEALSPEESDRAEIEGIAARRDAPVSEVENYQRYTSALRELNGQLINAAPAVYAGAYGTGHLGGAATLFFKGDPSLEAQNVIEDSGLDVNVRTDAKFSLRELDTLRDLAREAIEVTSPAHSVGLGIDYRSNRLTLSVDPNSELASILEEVGIELDDHILEPVTAFEGFHGRGGIEMAGATGPCMSGFTVYDLSTGETGITTAAHCEYVSEARDRSNAVFSTPFRKEHAGSYGDIEWHATSGHVDEPEFYHRPKGVNDTPWTAGSVAYQPFVVAWQDEFCSFSQVNPDYGRLCYYVRDPDFEWYLPAGSHPQCPSGCTVKSLYRMVNNFHTEGDSGGPWSWGSEVAGTVMGGYGAAPYQDAVVSAASSFDEALAVRILLN